VDVDVFNCHEEATVSWHNLHGDFLDCITVSGLIHPTAPDPQTPVGRVKVVSSSLGSVWGVSAELDACP